MPFLKFPAQTVLTAGLLAALIAAAPLTHGATAQELSGYTAPLGELQAPVEVPAGTRTNTDLAYVRDGHERQRLDLYVPPGDGPFPVVVYLHGGAYGDGDKSDTRALRFLARGYAVASVNYRLAGDAPFPAQIQDAKAAVRWLRANAAQYRLNGERIGVWGVAQGGHLAALLGTATDRPEWESVGEHREVSSAVQAVVDWYGPTDFTRMDAHALPGDLRHDAAESPESRLLGGPVQENAQRAAEANPVRYVGPDAAPFLIVHGLDDDQIPHNQSLLLMEALLEAKVPIGFLSLMGVGHGGEAFQTSEITDNMDRWFDRYVKGIRPSKAAPSR